MAIDAGLSHVFFSEEGLDDALKMAGLENLAHKLGNHRRAKEIRSALKSFSETLREVNEIVASGRLDSVLGYPERGGLYLHQLRSRMGTSLLSCAFEHKGERGVHSSARVVFERHPDHVVVISVSLEHDDAYQAANLRVVA